MSFTAQFCGLWLATAAGSLLKKCQKALPSSMLCSALPGHQWEGGSLPAHVTAGLQPSMVTRELCLKHHEGSGLRDGI